MKFKVKAVVTELRDAPSPTAAIKDFLEQDTELGEGIESEDHLWLKVDFGNAATQKGFVKAADCEDVTAAARREIPEGAIIETCITVELRFNAADSVKPWFVLGDFLIARAILETDLKNAGKKIPGSDAVGPMQVSTAEWDNYIQNGGALVRPGTVPGDRNDPIRQVDATAFRMHADLKALSALRTPAGSQDPFVPELLDVFFAYLTDSPVAALALRDAHATTSNHGTAATKFLRGPLTDNAVTALHLARAAYFGKEASPTSLGDVVANVEKALDDALNRAFEGIKQFIPEVLPKASKPEPGGGGTTFAEKAPPIMKNLMRDFGFKDFQAAGILGNIGRETGGFKFMQELKPVSGRGGLGWVQWTAGRRVKFEKFCADNRLNTSSDEGNYGFLKDEMTNDPFEKRIVPAMKAARTLEEATEVFERVYERAGVVALAERITWAKRALAALNGVGTAGTNAEKLKKLVDEGKIVFDSAIFRSELLGLNTGTKVAPGLQSLVLALMDELTASNFAGTKQLRISSLVRSGAGSHHTEGRAVDIGNEEIAAALLPRIATATRVRDLGIDELIFDAGIIGQGRNVFNFDRGRKHDFDDPTLTAHGNHIHFAVKA